MRSSSTWPEPVSPAVAPAGAAKSSSPTTPAPAPVPGEDSVAFAHRVLRTAILDGRLPPGEALSQVRLAAGLGISRTPLREAIGRLTAEGLVTGDFNRQVRVAGLDLADLEQMYAMRMVLEPLAIAATVPTLGELERRALAEHVDAMDEAVGAGAMADFRGHHRAFHLGLTAGGGARLRASLATLYDHSERYRSTYLHEDAHAGDASRRRLELSQEEHRAILAAAVTGRARGCADQQVAHLRRTVEVVLLEASELTSYGHMVRRAAEQHA